MSTNTISSQDLMSAIDDLIIQVHEEKLMQHSASFPASVSPMIKDLLNMLTFDNFDSISDKMVDIADLSSKENDGATLKLCVRIIFEKAANEPNFGSVYAKLCHKLRENISDEVKDTLIVGTVGGDLFRKYFIYRCQEDFNKVWKDMASMNGIPSSDKDGGLDLMSYSYDIMMKTTRQGLGLIRFIGELLKVQMLPGEILHECVKQLLANVKDPEEEEEIEGLCVLMSTIGILLDREKSRIHMNNYYSRMDELTRNTNLPSHIRFMVQDVMVSRAKMLAGGRPAPGSKTITVVPLEKTENAWIPGLGASQTPMTLNPDEPINYELVVRKVMGLLNRLTLERFDSISDTMVDIANLSSRENDGVVLKLCIQIIFEKAKDEPIFGCVYAKLCHKLHEKISDEVKDTSIPGSSGGKLFRKYLLHRCQEDFTTGWKDKASMNGVLLDCKDGEPDLMSDEYNTMMKARRQGLGLIHFIGELFKVQMLTEVIMHECVKKLLANVKDPEEEEIEGLCVLMTTIGLQLDHEKAKSHMDVYFSRMGELTKNTKLPNRMRFMVQDVIDLRANKWVNKRVAAGPKTIAAIHEEAAREQEEKEAMRRTALSGGSRGHQGRFGGGGQGRGNRGRPEPPPTTLLSDVAPLEKTDNAWTPNLGASQAPMTLNPDEPITQDQVARKVMGLLNKLTLEKFDIISDKMVDIANLSSKENDGATLKLCIQMTFEKATGEPIFGCVYAKLCHKLHEKVSEDVKDTSIPGSVGGNLFRKYLLRRCQENLIKGWKAMASMHGVSLIDKDGTPDLMSDEYNTMMKARRQGVGLIRFIVELFKVQMVTEVIMHECVKKLLANVKDPEEEDIEGLCVLMTTGGLQLDHEQAKSHMDVYFYRMVELTRNTKLPNRIRFMVQDVIDLRANKWISRRAAAGPKTITEIHAEAAREQEEKEMMRHTASSGGRGLNRRRKSAGAGGEQEEREMMHDTSSSAGRDLRNGRKESTITGVNNKQVAKVSIKVTLRNYLSSKDMSEMLVRAKDLKQFFRPLLVTELVEHSLVAEPSDVDSIAQMFKALLSHQVVTAKDFEAGFSRPIKSLPVLAIECPDAYKVIAQLLEAVGMDPARLSKP